MTMDAERGAVILATQGAGKERTDQVLVAPDLPPVEVEAAEPFGLASLPPTAAGGRGSEALIIWQTPDHGIALQLGDRRYKPALVAGEVVVYGSGGQEIRLGVDGSVSITAPGGVTIQPTGAAAAARAGDPVSYDAAWAAWFTAVALLGPGEPPATPWTIQSGSSTVKVGA